ncbi:MFS transporter [Aestuariivirga sp.]|uniref:MFS transporter n=1 Tax=Aestuariivirga sp. TaxID=2650926 RepID=UPI0039E44DB3
MQSSPSAARHAVFLVFLVLGLITGAWVPHIPLAKERLDVGAGVFGLALLSLAAGAVLSMPLAGVLINRFGSARLMAFIGVLLCVAFLGPIHAPDFWAFVAAGLVFGAAIGSLDVAMNAHGIAVEKAVKRPVMSSFHGAFSLGGMAGAFIGAYLLREAGEMAQSLIFAVGGLLLLSVSLPFLLPASADKGLSGSHFAWPTRATLGLGLLGFLALMVEGSILDWGAIFMRAKFLIEASTAALAFGTYQGGMAVARFTGDWLRQKFGAVRLVTVSAVLAAAGTTAALVAPSPTLAILAFIFAGLGIGNIAPVLFAGGGRLEPSAPGRGIAAVTTLGYAGFMAGPPLIGFTAEIGGLGVGLSLTVIACLIIAGFARTVDAADTF